MQNLSLIKFAWDIHYINMYKTYTVCPGSSDPFYVVSYYITLDTQNRAVRISGWIGCRAPRTSTRRTAGASGTVKSRTGKSDFTSKIL